MGEELLTTAFRLFDEGKLEAAEQLYRRCMLEPKHNDDEKTALHGLGFTLACKGDFDEAVYCYEKLLTMAKKEGNHFDEAIALHQIGMVYRMALNFAEALKFFVQEKELRENKLPDHHVGFSANAYELGFIALLEKRLDESGRHFDEALKYGVKADDQVCIGCALRGKGQYLVEIGNHKDAQKVYIRSMKAFEEADDTRGVEEVGRMLARIETKCTGK